MKGIGKRLLALALCILMVCPQVATVFAAPIENCPGGCAHLAAVGTTHYDTLEEAIAAAPEGSTVTLLADIAEQTALRIEKSITLDLGGKTLTGANGDEEGLLNVFADFTIQNGTLTTDAGTCLLATDCNLTVEKTAIMQATGDAAALILSTTAATPQANQQEEDEEQWVTAHINGQLKNLGGYPAVGIVSTGDFHIDATIGKKASITSKTCNAVEMYGTGKLTVSGGKLQGKEHAIVFDIPKDGVIEAAITDGQFTTEKEPVLILKEKGATAPAGFISGGTFTQDPAAYVADHCGVIRNSDKTYTVVSSFTLTFKAGGGSGSMKSVTVNCGKSVKLPKNGFTAPKGKDFAGWKIGSKTYAAGTSYTPKDNVTVTAQWKNHVHSGGTATCEKKPVCSSCGKTYGKVHAHKLKSIAASAPTCTKDGVTSHEKCTLCGKLFAGGVEISSRSVNIPSLGHEWETVEGIPATCLAEGLKAHRKCTECGKLQIDDETVKKSDLVIPAGNHVLEAVAAVSSTCKETGIIAHEHCSVCDQLFVNGQAVEADSLSQPTVSHILSDWYCDETEHWKCCVNCGDAFRLKAHADTDQDGICNDCDYHMIVPPVVEEQAPEEPESGFNWLFLIPVIAAVAIAVPLALKKRK